MSRITSILAALALSLLIAGCGEEPKEPEFPNPLLNRVPADTPYVLASGEPVSEAVSEAWAERFRPAIDIARQQFNQTIKEIEAENPALASQLSAIVDELLTLAEKDEREKIGVTREDRVVIYGNGLMPVVRMTVSDPEAFRAFLTRIGNKSGIGMGSTTYEGQQVSRLAMDPAVVLGALQDGVLSVGVSTLDGEQAMKDHLFGAQISGETLADSGAMTALIEQYDFMSAGAGYLDVPGLLRRIIGDGDVPGLLDQFDVVPQELTPACRTELVSLAGKAPRLVFGYKEMTESVMDMRTVLELEPAIAEDMTGWTVPVPGLGAPSDARYAFGMSLDGTKAAQTVKGWLATAGERDFQCGFLAETPWKESATKINVAPLYMVGNPKGFLFQLNELEIRDIEARDFTASASAVAVFDNAQTLAGMVRMMAPQLQTMEIPTDGTPVQMPAEATGDLDQPIWFASTETTLAMALGDGAEGRVGEAMNAEAPSPAPFIHFDFDAGWLYNMLADWMPRIAREAKAAKQAAEQAQDVEPGTENEGTAPEGEEAAPDESEDGQLSAEEIAELEQAAEMMRVYGRILGRMSYQVRFTQQGVEVVTHTTLKE